MVRERSPSADDRGTGEVPHVAGSICQDDRGTGGGWGCIVTVGMMLTVVYWFLRGREQLRLIGSIQE